MQLARFPRNSFEASVCQWHTLQQTTEMTSTYNLIENELSKWSQRVIRVRPDLSHIEDVPAILLCLLCSHYLNVSCPRWEVSFVNGFEEVLKVVIWIFSAHFGGLFSVESLDSLIGLQVDLDVNKRSVLLPFSMGLQSGSCDLIYLFREFVGMPAERIYSTQRRWSASITEQVHECVNSFLIIVVKAGNLSEMLTGCVISTYSQNY
jgi:hypothetical protein